MDKVRDSLAAFAKLVGWPLVKAQAASLGLEARTTYVVEQTAPPLPIPPASGDHVNEEGS